MGNMVSAASPSPLPLKAGSAGHPFSPLFAMACALLTMFNVFSRATMASIMYCISHLFNQRGCTFGLEPFKDHPWVVLIGSLANVVVHPSTCSWVDGRTVDAGCIHR